MPAVLRTLNDYAVNLLENWFKHFKWISSDLNPNKSIDRKAIELIYDTLRLYFGLDYYEIDQNEKQPKRIEDWIKFLLARADVSGVEALYDISKILAYSTTLSEKIQEKLFSVRKRPDKFRELLFELYVFAILDYNEIPNRKKVLKGKQELEGILHLENQECVFECNKPYIPNLKKVSELQHLNIVFYKFFANLDEGVEVAGYFSFRENTKNLVGILQRFLKKFKHQLKLSKGSELDFELTNTDCRLLVYPRDDKRFELDKIRNPKNTLFFKTIGPVVPMPGQIVQFRVNLQYGFSFTDEEVTKKFIYNIKKKRDQLSGFQDDIRVFFVDNEIQRDLILPIMPNKSSIRKEAIQNYLDGKTTKDIVVLITRDYSSGQVEKRIEVFGRTGMEIFMERLKKLKLP